MSAIPRKLAAPVTLGKGPEKLSKWPRQNPAKIHAATMRAHARKSFSKRGKNSGYFSQARLKENHQSAKARKPLNAAKLSNDSEEFQADKSTHPTPKRTKRPKKSRRKTAPERPGGFEKTSRSPRLKTKRAAQSTANSRLKRTGTAVAGIRTQAAKVPGKTTQVIRPKKEDGNFKEPTTIRPPKRKRGK